MLEKYEVSTVGHFLASWVHPNLLQDSQWYGNKSHSNQQFCQSKCSWPPHWVVKYITHLWHVSYLSVMMSVTIYIVFLGSESPPYPNDSIIIILSTSPFLVFKYLQKKKGNTYFLEDFESLEWCCWHGYCTLRRCSVFYLVRPPAKEFCDHPNFFQGLER